MEISKSTPYVRYRENISSTLHKGTIHIESEYLDRERKTTIESIEGQTWQNIVNGENKEEDILPRLGLKIEGNEDVLDTVEQHMPIDTIIGDVEPIANEDGTYTYEISTMEGSYAKTLDGENNFSLTSDGLVGDMYIKYNAQGEEVNGNIVMNGQNSYTIENSNNGEINGATLKGQTLVNLVANSSIEKTVGKSSGTEAKYDYIYQLETNKQYTIRFEISNFNGTNPMHCSFDDGLSGMKNITIDKNGVYKAKFTTDKKSNQVWFFWTISNWEDGNSATVKNIMILEGDYTNQDIPYFTGMQSVRMPVLTTNNSNLVMPSDFERGYIDATTGQNNSGGYQEYCRTIGFVDVKGFIGIIYGSAKYNDTIRSVQLIGYDKDKNLIKSSTNLIDVTSDIRYIRANIHTPQNPSDPTKLYDIYISSKDLYEPHKSTTLSTPSDLKLRKIGDVQDELDLETGILTQRISEISFKSSDGWSLNGLSFNNVYEFRYELPIKGINHKCISNNFIQGSNGDYERLNVHNTSNGITYLYLCINKSKLLSNTLESLNDYLIANPLIVQYELATPIITQLDLTIKDQDDKIIQSLLTHPSTTHINLSSDGLIPSAEIN